MVGYVVGGLMGVLFRLGSLLYLTATAILCLDVIILHRYIYVYLPLSQTTSFNFGGSVAGLEQSPCEIFLSR